MSKNKKAPTEAKAQKNKADTGIVARERKITAKFITTCNAMVMADSSIRKAHQANGGFQGASRRQFRQWMKKEGYTAEEQSFYLVAYGYDAGGEA